MKKNLFFGLFATMVLLLTTACQKENDLLGNGEATISFEISTPQMATRAFSDGTTATVLKYAVYHKVGEGYELLRDAETAELDGKKAHVDVQLATGKTYSVLFWAQADGAPFVLDYDNLTMAVTYGKCNDENYDAFYWFNEVEVNGAATVGVTLTRPFAQLNIGTNDLESIDDVSVKKTAVTVENVYNTFNFALGNVQGTPASVTFTSNDRPAAAETFPVTGYEYLAMNYILVQKEGEVLNEVILTYDNNNKSRSFTNIPVKANHRTNIYGALLTNNIGFDVDIDNEFDTPDENVEVWDGKTIKEPVFDAINNIYEIYTGAQLAYIAQLVNGTLDTDNVTRDVVAADNLAGKTVKLMCEIDLGGKEWTPIGDSEHIFKGTFDGDGKVVKNLVITGNNSNVGLFGVTHDGEIKNFTVENAKVSGRLNVGVVAGQPYTSKYTGITVKGHVEVNGMAYVGGVGGKNAYADWTNVTVNADETSYVKANSVENGTAYRTYVGGVVGFNGEGGHKFSNITSNINVEGSTCDVGGLFGIAHYGNQFENLTCTGNVKITKAEESEEAEEIGGIAGVWHNGGQDVVFTNCEFTGEVTTNVARETVWYDNLFGKPYNNNGAGKLILNGYEMVGNGVGMKDGEYYVFNGYGMRWIASTVNAGTSSFKDKTIKLVNDIDLSGTQWMPIGYGQNRFNGTFDGQGKTISGMTITEYNGQPQAALFGNVALTTTFKNLTISGANVVMPTNHTGDFYAAGLIGTFYGTVTIENVTVKESTFVGNNKVAGLIAHDGVSSNLSINNCHILDCNISSANTADGGNVGGMVGLFQGAANGEYIIANSSVKNCTIVGINSSNSGKRANAEFVACVNSKANQTLVIENCVVEGNTFSQTINGSDAVTYVGPYDNKFVGGHREGNEPAGIVVINGVQYPNTAVSTWDEFTAALAAGETYIVLTGDITYDANYQLQKDVTIDLNGKSMTLPMINIHTKTTIKNGTINGKVYARKNSEIVFNKVTFSGAVADNLSTEGHLAIQGGCKSLYAKDCLFSPTSVSGSQTKPLSFEGGSTIMKFENCEFKSSPYKKQVYFNSLSATGSLDFTNCNFNNKTPNIMLAAACPFTNVQMSGTTKLTSVTLEINRAKDVVTDADLAYLREMIANNSFSSVRLFYAGGSSEYIR